MRESNHELLTESVDANPELLESYKKHKKLEKQVESFSKYASYSSAAAMKLKDLKKQKLIVMDKILKGQS